MTDAELLAILDKIDIWILSGAEENAMRSLREALVLAHARGPQTKLFRPGGFGTTAVWIDGDQIARLLSALAQAAA